MRDRRRGIRHGRHRIARAVAGFLGLVLAVLLPGAAVTGASAAAAADKTTFTVAILTDVDSFNPFLGIKATSYEAWALMYDYMTGYSMKNMSPKPGLATQWHHSADGLRWTFDIRTGVKWSDGQPLTARDIAYTYNRVLHGTTESSSWIAYLQYVDKVTAPDATHVVLKLKKPNATLPLLPIPIVPQHVWKNVSEKDVKTYANEPKGGQPVVGSGPFRLVQGTASGSQYTFERNPDYWGGTPHLDQVVFKVYQSEDPAAQALIKGEVDEVDDISALMVKKLSTKPGITAQNGNSPGFDEIAFNTGSVDTKTGKPIGDANPALADPKFRHALGYALDLPQLIKKVYQGAGVPGATIVPPAYSQWIWQPPPDQAFHFDLAKAGQLLDEAGYRKGADGQRTMPDGKPIGTLRLYARTSSPTSLNTMTYFSQWLKQLGISSKVSAMNSNKLTDVILQGNFDAFQWGWFVEPDPNSMLSYMTCGQRGGWSDSWFCDKRYDRMYQQQATEMDLAKRQDIVKKMQELLYQQSPYLVTAYNTTGEAIRSDRFACLVPQPDPGGVWLFQYGVYNYIHMVPASQAQSCASAKNAVTATSGGSSTLAMGTTALLLGGLAFGLAMFAVGWVAGQRRLPEWDRE